MADTNLKTTFNTAPTLYSFVEQAFEMWKPIGKRIDIYLQL